MRPRKQWFILVVLWFSIYPCALILDLAIDHLWFHQQFRWAVLFSSKRALLYQTASDSLQATVWTGLWLLNSAFFLLLRKWWQHDFRRAVGSYYLPAAALLYCWVANLPSLLVCLALTMIIATVFANIVFRS